ncbi:recombinase zinc beta ribbon domain-containing protein [Chloroflexota bacterium]
MRLHSLGIKSPSGNDVWNRTTVYKTLRNSAYTGVANVQGIEVTQPQIIPRDKFALAQAKLKRNKELASRNAKHEYLLSGHIFCRHCGRRYIGQITRSENRAVRYYNCSAGSKRKSLDPCIAKALRADSVELIVWLEIEKALTQPETILAGLETVYDDDYSNEIDVLSSKLRNRESQKQRCWKAFEITNDEETFRREIAQIDSDIESLQKLLSEIKSLTATLTQMPKETDVKRACELISRNLGKLTFKEKREVIEMLNIRVHTGEALRLEGILPIELPQTGWRSGAH